MPEDRKPTREECFKAAVPALRRLILEHRALEAERAKAAEDVALDAPHP